MDRIEEIFVPQTIETVADLIAFLINEIERQGGDPETVKILNTGEAIPNVRHSDEWPCMTIKFDKAKSESD